MILFDWQYKVAHSDARLYDHAKEGLYEGGDTLLDLVFIIKHYLRIVKPHMNEVIMGVRLVGLTRKDSFVIGLSIVLSFLIPR